ncbi:hypothetical protein [Microbulbifer sp. 2205BS26-8]|uniref:hypothetical protein n=1 Tax=Microbulbifer sp. 2205BS26-8 TaxID=3064386 RepID=UPI00273D5958|nr:hypothetical protein [Microbulbifer sp. 2205BS26-8]MDP5208916.1 hypothetical protein [Microbulbifer sp. 2205BS26-8]
MSRRRSVNTTLCLVSFLPAWFATLALAWQDEGEAAFSQTVTHLEAQFAGAAVVAQVEVIDIHRDVDSALSAPGVTAISGYVYSAAPSRVWKGAVAEQITFRLGLEYCDRKLEVGERYLIFAGRDAYGRLQLLSCEAAVAESDAATLLAILSDLTARDQPCSQRAKFWRNCPGGCWVHRRPLTPGQLGHTT